jgi:hypothetical protein
VSSQIILEASRKAEINRRWPEDPLAAGKRALRPEALEKIECDECHGCMQPRAMKSISIKAEINR